MKGKCMDAMFSQGIVCHGYGGIGHDSDVQKASLVLVNRSRQKFRRAE